MATRFASATQNYFKTLAYGASSTGTICCWAKITTDRNTYSVIWQIQPVSGSGTVCQTDVDGTTLRVWANSAWASGPSRAMTVGTWYFVAVTWSGTTGVMYTRSLADTSMTTQSWTGAPTAQAWQDLYIGDDNASEFWNGCVCAFKGWMVQLTATEVANEMWQYMPGRVDGLKFWYPLLKPETIDYSGNAVSLTGGTGTVFEAGPGIPWRQGRRAKRRYTGIFVPEPDPGPEEALLAQITPAMGGWPGHL